MMGPKKENEMKTKEITNITSPHSLLKMLSDVGRPGSEHKKLDPLVGARDGADDFILTAKFWSDPKQPPVVATGTAHKRWIMGGRFIQANLKFEFEGETFEQLNVFGYDSAHKNFYVVSFSGLDGSLSFNTITINSRGDSFEWATEERSPITGEIIKGRTAIVVETPDRIALYAYITLNGEEVKVKEITNVRLGRPTRAKGQ
jgi:uncharacterized protein DUF1579